MAFVFLFQTKNAMENNQTSMKLLDEQAFSKATERVDEFISSLRKTSEWKGLHPMVLYQGFWYNKVSLRGIVLAQQLFKPEPGDMILCSAPKCGTTWLKALAFAIATRTCYEPTASPLRTKNPHECVPDYFDILGKNVEREAGLPLLATHAAFASLPESILHTDGCKIVYICREPKDAFVSLFHFVNKIKRKKNLEPIPLDRAFDLFCEGKAYYGPFWENVLEYWKASWEFPGKILFLKYEELKKDSEFHVKKLAEFMGYPFSAEEEKAGKVGRIVELCSFEGLSSLDVNKTGQTQRNSVVENKNFFRKGEVAGWKELLTEEMAKRLDKITEEKFGGHGLDFA